jgi:hypothetical protein
MKKLLTPALALAVLAASTGPAVADYLDLSVGGGANPATNIYLSWNGYSGKTFKVEWRKASGGTWTKKTVNEGDVTVGSGYRWSYIVGNLSCQTKYDFRVKLEGRGWREQSVSTSGCGTPCQIAAGNLVLSSSGDKVFFIGTDKRVYNHWWDGSKWRLNALDYSAPAAIAAGNLVLSSSGDKVFFIGIDKRVYNHWWDGTNWQLNALDYSAPAAIAAGNLVLSSSGDKVFFIGTDKRVYNHWWDGSKWRLNALDYSAPAAIAAGNLVRSSSGDKVFFIGIDKRVYNHWWDGSKWRLDWLCQ